MGRRGLRATCAVGALLLLGASTASAGASAPARSASSGGLYVALGDSLTAGHGFVDQLFVHYRSALGVTELSNRATAAGGGVTSDVLRRRMLERSLADINAASDTRVVTITIGANDALAGCDFTSPACAFRANFSATLADLQAALANDPGAEQLIPHAMYNPWVGEPKEAEVDRLLLGTPAELSCADTGPELGLNDIVAQEALAHETPLANSYPAFKAHGQAYMNVPNDLHPNDAGTAAIADAFINAGEPCATECSTAEKKVKKAKRKVRRARKAEGNNAQKKVKKAKKKLRKAKKAQQAACVT